MGQPKICNFSEILNRRGSRHRPANVVKLLWSWYQFPIMKKMIFTFALPVLGMILSSCASEQPATTPTPTTIQQQVTEPRPETIRPVPMRGGM
ncbi:MAG: hypothetical protein DME49_13720 [Verrucomicrobia bacterium]|nr:MAG: hypothetical protein DME49_13720 [Verrucomicrobiota bacterium]